MKFRKKSEVVDAVQWTGDNLGEIRNFLGRDYILNQNRVLIENPEGPKWCRAMWCPLGHWVVRFPSGMLGALTPALFDANYEPADGEVAS